MSDDRIDVKIGATTGELKTGMAQAEQTVKQGVQGMQSPFDRMRQTVTGGMQQMQSGVTNALSGIGSAFGGLSTILLGVGLTTAGAIGFVKNAVEETIKWNSEARSLSRSLGITTEEASALNEAIQDLGIKTLNSNLSTSTLKHGLSMMRRELANNEQGFNDLGIATRTSNGEFRNSLDIFLDAMGYLQGLEGETLKNVQGTKLFKRSWDEVRPLMGLTQEAVAKTSEELRQQGRLVTEEGVQKSVEYKQALDQLNDSYHALSLTIGNAVTPILTKMANVMNWVSSVIAHQGEVLRRLIDAWNQLGSASGAKGGGGGGGWGDEPGNRPERKSGGMPIDAPAKGGGGGGKGGGGPSLVQQWVQELEAMKAAEEKYQSRSLQMEKAFWAKKLATGKAATAEETDALKAQELAGEAIRLKGEADYWKGKLLLAKAGSKDYQEVQHKIFPLEQQQNKARLQGEINLIKSKIKAGEESLKDKVALIEHENQLDKLNIKMKEQNTAHLAKMGTISRVQELKEYKLFLKEKQMADLKAEKDTLKAHTGDEKAYAKHLNNLELLEKKHAAETQQINFEIAEALKTQWGQVWTAVSQAFTLSIQGIITGTTTLAEALNNIWQSILTSLVGMFIEMALQWIAAKVMMLIFGQAADKTMALSSIAAESGIAGAAGVASVMVAVPYPANIAMAPAVGAAAAMMAMSYGALASAAGGWDVPADTLAMVHKDEKILPADWPEKLRAVAAPGGAAGPTRLVAKIPITVVTPDGRTLLKENKTLFFDLANQGIKRGEIRIGGRSRP